MAQDTLSRAGLAGSFLAFFAALCCVLPIALMALGLGGAWIAIFGKIAAASLWAVGLSALLLAVAWVVAVRRRASSNTVGVLAAGSLLTFLAWCLILNEAVINNFLIARM